MKITSIPQIYRHVNRWREIFTVLSKYGLADWVSRIDLQFAKEYFKDASGEVLAKHTTETRLRLALNELGPTFVKLGQVLSTRPDLIGVALATELQQLQDSTHADPPGVVRATVEKELGQPIAELFDEFVDKPLASASIGQVHAARLKAGESVVVKVQHAGIEDKVAVDLEILQGLAMLAEKIPEFAYYRPQATVAEFQRTLRRELDYGREERNLQQFASDFAGDATIHVPGSHTEFCTGRVLAMERLEGIRLGERDRLLAAGLDLEEVARRGADIYLRMIFINGFYHADPHPGNILLLPGNVIGLLDFGMVGRIDEQLREDIEEMLLAITNRDSTQLTRIIMRVGAAPADLDEASLSVDVSDFLSHYASQQLGDLDLSGALNEMVEMIRRYHITLPARVAMLIKTLVMLEGTSRQLAPKFSLVDVMLPYQKKMIWRRLSPARQLKKMRRLASELERLAEILPRGLIDIVQQVQSGKFDIHLDHRGLEPSVNRLVFGMLTSALFLGSTLLISRNVPPLLNLPSIFGLPELVTDFSILGGLGCGISIALGLRLLRAINKSGHLDRRN